MIQIRVVFLEPQLVFCVSVFFFRFQLNEFEPNTIRSNIFSEVWKEIMYVSLVMHFNVIINCSGIIKFEPKIINLWRNSLKTGMKKRKDVLYTLFFHNFYWWILSFLVLFVYNVQAVRGINAFEPETIYEASVKETFLQFIIFIFVTLLWCIVKVDQNSRYI